MPFHAAIPESIEGFRCRHSGRHERQSGRDAITIYYTTLITGEGRRDGARWIECDRATVCVLEVRCPFMPPFRKAWKVFDAAIPEGTKDRVTETRLQYRVLHTM
jgi:hypothetical protein